MQRAYSWLALLASVLVAVAARAEHNDTETLGIADPLMEHAVLERAVLIEAVLDRNPSLEAARQAWAAALAGISQASSLEDPMATYSLAPLSIASDARFGHVFQVGQRFPSPGTLHLRGEAAESVASAAQYRIVELRQRLATAASLLFDDYWLVARAQSITDEHIDLLESFQRIATSRYATGLAPQQAPIQAEVEAAHLLHRRVVLRTEHRKLVARLNALLHRRAAAPLPPAPTRLDIEPLEARVLAVEPAEVAEVAESYRPEVAARQAEVEVLRARVALENLRLKPDFEAMASYNSMWGTTEHQWMVGVGLRLPVWRKQLRASVAASEARLAAGESDLVALSDTVAAEVEVALAAVEEAGHVVRLYRNRVLPAARDQVAAARAGFETGEGSMLGLIDAERSLLAAELSHEEAVVGVASARAELDRALGRMPFGLATSPPRSAPTVSSEGDLP